MTSGQQSPEFIRWQNPGKSKIGPWPLQLKRLLESQRWAGEASWGLSVIHSMMLGAGSQLHVRIPRWSPPYEPIDVPHLGLWDGCLEHWQWYYRGDLQAVKAPASQIHSYQAARSIHSRHTENTALCYIYRESYKTRTDMIRSLGKLKATTQKAS